MPFIRLKNEAGEESFLRIPEDRTLVFGRENYCDYQLKMEAEISREHFSVGPGDAPNLFVLVDLGSRNGTFLNGEKLGNDAVELKEGDEIRAGSQRFAYFKTMPDGAWKKCSAEILRGPRRS
jgi:pSer/pThr/pTyr-binding forkhead associated (FHA) protein